jgi:hypothetical protein
MFIPVLPSFPLILCSNWFWSGFKSQSRSGRSRGRAGCQQICLCAPLPHRRLLSVRPDCGRALSGARLRRLAPSARIPPPATGIGRLCLDLAGHHLDLAGAGLLWPDLAAPLLCSPAYCARWCSTGWARSDERARHSTSVCLFMCVDNAKKKEEEFCWSHNSVFLIRLCCYFSLSTDVWWYQLCRFCAHICVYMRGLRL